MPDPKYLKIITLPTIKLQLLQGYITSLSSRRILSSGPTLFYGRYHFFLLVEGDLFLHCRDIFCHRALQRSVKQYFTSACQMLKQACCKEKWKIQGCIAKENTNLHHNNPPFQTVSKGFWNWILLYFCSSWKKKTVPIMPCSSPKHAPLRFRGQLLGRYV